MVDLLVYGEKGSAAKSFATLLVIATLTVIFLLSWEINLLLSESFPSFHSSYLPEGVLLIWRLFCLAVGASAIVYMFRMETGNMVVVNHQTRLEELIHPLKWEKFVTFSSWTLIANFLYFLTAFLASGILLLNRTIPSWIEWLQVAIFATALGSAFLTSTIVRLVILPGEVRQRRNHDHQFLFHNQIMHNFAAIFLAVEIILSQPDLRPEFALFGLLLGIVYALFAFPFAYFWGGYYVYGFIDPRLRFAPLLQAGLASAVSVFYLGLWLISELLSFNLFLGILILSLWVSQIIQFRTALSKEEEI